MATTARHRPRRPARRSTPAVQDIPYASVTGVDPGRLSLDVYPPTHGCPAPVVVWVHGGGWRTGDKSNQMRDKVRLWRDAGYTVVSVELPAHRPGRDADRCATRRTTRTSPRRSAWVHDHIADFGGDPDRIALLGHSAGAQIVAGRRDRRALSRRPRARPRRRSGASVHSTPRATTSTAMASTGNPVYRAAFGDDPATWVDASPIVHVEPGQGHPRGSSSSNGAHRDAGAPSRPSRPGCVARGWRPRSWTPGRCPTPR